MIDPHPQLTHSVEVWVREYLWHHQGSLSVTWDVTFQSLPDPSTGGYVPTVVIYLGFEAAEDCPAVFASPLLRPYGLTKELVEHLVADTLHSMAGEREQARTRASEERLASG